MTMRRTNSLLSATSSNRWADSSCMMAMMMMIMVMMVMVMVMMMMVMSHVSGSAIFRFFSG